MSLNKIAKRQIFMSFDALDYLIDVTPEDIWNSKKGGFVFWQQILHAITGTLFWLRVENDEFTEPFADLNVYPELEKDPENEVSKEQMKGLLKEVVELTHSFFDYNDSKELLNPSVLYNKITGLDVVFGQIRHLQYHIGHCESILREAGIADLKWEEYYGE